MIEKKVESQAVVYLLGFLVFVFSVVALVYLKSVLIPFVVALILAMLGRPIVHRLEKWHCPTFLASILYILLLMVLLFIGSLFMVTIVQGFVKKSGEYQKQYIQLYQNYSGQIKSTLSRFDSEKVNFSEILDSVIPEKPTIDLGFASVEEENQFIGKIPETEEIPGKLEKKSIFSLFNWEWMVRPMMNFAFSFGNFFKSFVTIMLFLFFILIEWPFLREKLNRFSKKESPSLSLLQVLIGVNRSLSKYFYIKIVVSLITALLVMMLGYFVSLDFLLMWGVLAFVLNFIPSIGSIFFWALVTVMSVIQYAPTSDLTSIFVVSFGVFAIEMIVGNIIDPLVSGDSLDLSPLVIVIGLMFWGYLWGIIGMFLSVPIMLFVRAFCAYVPDLEPVALMMGSGRLSPRFKRSCPFKPNACPIKRLFLRGKRWWSQKKLQQKEAKKLSQQKKG